MPAAVNPDSGERREGLSPALCAYYRGEGWQIEDDENDSPQFPIMFPDGERFDPEAQPTEYASGGEGAAEGTEGADRAPDQTADQDGGGTTLDLGKAGQHRP